jgi:hypothetical protein
MVDDEGLEVFGNENFKDEIKPEYMPGKVSSEVVARKVVCEDTNDFVGHIAYHSLQEAARGRAF